MCSAKDGISQIELCRHKCGAQYSDDLMCNLYVCVASIGSWLTFVASHPEKLEVDALTVQHGVEGLMYLLMECSKLMASLTTALHVIVAECEVRLQI